MRLAWDRPGGSWNGRATATRRDVQEGGRLPRRPRTTMRMPVLVKRRRLRHRRAERGAHRHAPPNHGCPADQPREYHPHRARHRHLRLRSHHQPRATRRRAVARTRCAPWAALMLAISPVLHFIFVVVVPIQALDALALGPVRPRLRRRRPCPTPRDRPQPELIPPPDAAMAGQQIARPALAGGKARAKEARHPTRPPAATRHRWTGRGLAPTGSVGPSSP
jgi:hypothetical protein